MGWLAVALIIGLTGATIAGSTATLTVKYEVKEMAALNVTGLLSQPVVVRAPESDDLRPVRYSSTYLQYTSVVPEHRTRSITVALVAGAVPAGCAIKLEVISLSGTGDCGAPVPGGLYLTSIPQAIIAGIGNGCTGSRSTDGARIACTLVVDDSTNLVPGETPTILALFTLTDAS